MPRPHIAANEDRGAFLLASDGGLDSGGGKDGGEEPHLPVDAPTCLKKVLNSPLTCESNPLAKKHGNGWSK